MSNTVAVVTGAAGGIGAAVSQRLLESGASVMLTDVRADALERTAVTLGEVHEGRLRWRPADCAVDRDLSAVLADAASLGPVTMYVANAGVFVGFGLGAADALWSQSWDVNVMAHVRAARQLIPGWLERGAGTWVTTASAAGLLTQLGSPTYSVTKHAAVAFAEWLRVTYGDRGIAVTCLCPMGVNTQMLRDGADSPDPAQREAARAVLQTAPALEPLEVADVLLEAVGRGEFLALPHPEVLDFFRRKSGDYDRWLAGMQRHRRSLDGP